MKKPTRRAFVKTIGLGALGIGLLAELPSCTDNAPLSAPARFTGLPRSTPERQGISSSAILEFLEAVDASEQEFHGFMLVRNGHVVSEGWWSPFKAEYFHTLYSLSKSFTSTAVGMMVDDQKISVEDKVISFFPEDLPENVSDNLRTMRVKDLLTMNTGHDLRTMDTMLVAPDGNWPRAFLAHEVEYTPGTHFFYNTGATYMLSAIVQKVSGQTVEDLLTERLFNPLNIIGSDWEVDPKGVNVGGYGLRLQLEDIATFGQLYLQQGEWNGQQIISKKWVDEATKKQVDSQDNDSDWGQGYGYQFWRCKPEPGFYRGDGAFGQYCIVIPQQQTVIAINSESKDMQASMNLVWDHLLPALGEQPLTEDNSALARLKNKTNTLVVPTKSIQAASPLEKQISGKRYKLDDNDQKATNFLVSFVNNQCTVQIERADGMRAIQCGKSNWTVNSGGYLPTPSILTSPKQQKVLSKVAAYYTWQDDQTLLINLKFIENMHGDTWTCKFDKNMVEVSFLNSIAEMRKEVDERMDWKGQY
jgi:CubicO group peptidase (beta-lactamase class C family)